MERPDKIQSDPPVQESQKIEDVLKPEELKVMEKVVDIYEEKDLKYRDSYDIFRLATDLQTGLISAYNKHFYDENLPFADGLKKTRQAKHQEKSFRDQVYGEHYNPSPGSEDDFKFKEYSHKANVFYPEGILKVVDGMLGDANLLQELVFSPVYIRRILLTFFEVCCKKLKNSKELILDKKTIYGLFLIISEKDKDFHFNHLDDYSDEDGFLFTYAFSKLSQEELEVLKETARKYFFDNFEQIRRRWLEAFFVGAMGKADNRMVHYRPSFGVVYDSDATVRLSSIVITLHRRRYWTLTIRDMWPVYL